VSKNLQGKEEENSFSIEKNKNAQYASKRNAKEISLYYGFKSIHLN